VLDEACDEFAIERGGDEDADAEVAVAVGGEEQAAVPEDVDAGVLRVVVGWAGGGVVVFLEAEREAECA